MIRPHPPRLRMKRRKTVSVTPAMGARTVAGAIWTPPIERLAATGFSGAAGRARAPAPHSPTELSQDLRTDLFYLAFQAKAPALRRGLNFRYIRGNPRKSVAKISSLPPRAWLVRARSWRTCGGSAPHVRQYPSASAYQ